MIERGDMGQERKEWKIVNNENYWASGHQLGREEGNLGRGGKA
jgi:hypothetical protein